MAHEISQNLCISVMSVRVVARIRPLLKSELDKDSIIESASLDGASRASLVRIPNPKNAAESYSFNFNAVYDQSASQQDLFDSESLSRLFLESLAPH